MRLNMAKDSKIKYRLNKINTNRVQIKSTSDGPMISPENRKRYSNHFSE